MQWTHDKPTEPGWWWYEDEGYGPAPIFVCWTGFINHPEARSLDVDMCMGEDQDLLGQPVSELNGRWHRLDKPVGA